MDKEKLIKPYTKCITRYGLIGRKTIIHIRNDHKNQESHIKLHNIDRSISHLTNYNLVYQTS
jgi:hypothetical protein